LVVKNRGKFTLHIPLPEADSGREIFKEKKKTRTEMSANQPTIIGIYHIRTEIFLFKNSR
jgi:hypothetical protein